MLELPPPERFRPIGQQQHLDIADRVCPMRYEISERAAEPQRRLLARQIGPVSLVRYEGRGIEHGQRTIEHVRAESTDYFILSLPLRARFHFSHVGLRTDVDSGAAVLLTSRQPFDAYIRGARADDAHSSLQLRIPGPLLRSRVPAADQLCNRAFSVIAGAGQLLETMLLASLREADPLNSEQALRHGQILVDLLANALLELEPAPMAGADRPSTQRIFARAMAFIECRLSDAQLGAEQIARHCHVSPRYLHKIFAQRSQTIAGCVREMRLQRCHAALRDARLAGRSVIEIANHWGFSDPSHFGRLYRKRFGMPPSQARRGASTAGTLN